MNENVQRAREVLRMASRLATGRMCIERTEHALKTPLMSVWNDDDLVVIFADKFRQFGRPEPSEETREP